MKAIEFYTTPEGEVTLRPEGEAEHQLKESDTEFIQSFLEIIKEFYTEAHDALMDVYSKSSANKKYRDFLAVRRFIKCNFGCYDNMIDIDENRTFRFEFVSCPLRGECKHDHIICAPRFNSKLTERQLEIMRMAHEGKSDDEISEKLFISLNTVNNHRKNSFMKVGVHSMPEFMRYANKHNIFLNAKLCVK
jgi:DNA-binding CsgD family transcriptional regulator